MTKAEYLALAEAQYDKIKKLQELSSFYDYEKGFEEIWLEYGRKTLERSISKEEKNRRKKKD